MIGGAAKIIRESGKWQEAVQGCLAAGSFADDCVGHVLGALNKSAYKDNTVVILWGDHGYDICEKTFAKSALWQQTTRTPIIIHVPEKLGGNKDVNCFLRDGGREYFVKFFLNSFTFGPKASILPFNVTTFIS